jgi:hypothetical protein
MRKTRIADDGKAIAVRLQELRGQREAMMASNSFTDAKVGYFFELLAEKHRGMKGRLLFFHQEIGGCESLFGTVCDNCNPTACNCAADIAYEHDFDVADFGYPDVYFCTDCP